MQELSTLHKTDETRSPGRGSCPACGSNGAEKWLEAPDRFHGRPQTYQLMRCSSCTVIWLDNPPQPEIMGEHYGPDYHRLITNAGETSPERWRGYGSTLAQYKKSGALLDLGCSSGAFLTSLKDQPWQLYGIEMAASSAEKARARSGAQVFVGDIEEAPFSPESFDVITSFDVLEHLYRPRHTMEKVWEWLKPEGIFYVVIPNILSWEARLFGSYWYGLELPRHLLHFSPESLRNLLTSVGFREETLKTPPIHYLEYSTRYAFDEMLHKVGLSRPPLSVGTNPGIPWKVVRKAMRLTALSLFAGTASLAGAGPSMEAIFRKGPRPSFAKRDAVS